MKRRTLLKSFLGLLALPLLPFRRKPHYNGKIGPVVVSNNGDAIRCYNFDGNSNVIPDPKAADWGTFGYVRVVDTRLDTRLIEAEREWADLWINHPTVDDNGYHGVAKKA